MTKICVLGLGYIGLPTASLLATRGHAVVGVDTNASVVDTINSGGIHIHEPDLDVLVRAAVQSGNLHASTTPSEADIYIVAVPTPFKEEHRPDLSYVEAATKSIAPYLKKNSLVILESTSPVGTVQKMSLWLRQLRSDLKIAPEAGSDVFLAHCPERVLPGQILKELVNNDRIIGGITKESSERAKTFYETFVSGEIFLTDDKTAELAKLTENAFRDVNIAFANELSMICDRLSVDVWELIRLANRHPRVKILQPGPGVGGHCIAVDPWFIVDSAPEESPLLRTARGVNNQKPKFILSKIRQAIKGKNTATVACLGLAFKADVDDLRESPSVEITELLAQEEGIKILAVEPHIKVLPRQLSKYGNIQLVDEETALAKADAIVLLVNHKAFSRIDRKQLGNKPVVDTRGFWR